MSTAGPAAVCVVDDGAFAAFAVGVDGELLQAASTTPRRATTPTAATARLAVPHRSSDITDPPIYAPVTPRRAFPTRGDRTVLACQSRTRPGASPSARERTARRLGGA
ncbi:MAG: hypothetical protein ACYCV5_09045, partial [Acidimicrobiales bacterium]